MYPDSQLNLDFEALCFRIANLKYLWTSPEVDGTLPAPPLPPPPPPPPAAAPVAAAAAVAEEDNREETALLSCNEFFPDLPLLPRGPDNNLNSFMVSITPAEEIASTIPLGFQDVLPENPNKPRRKDAGKPMVCNFCKNNREVRDIYLTHYLYDPITKVLSCPVLRKHICEICGDTGDNAHTLQYCRLNKARGAAKGNVPKMLCTLSVTNSAGKIRKN